MTNFITYLKSNNVIHYITMNVIETAQKKAYNLTTQLTEYANDIGKKLTEEDMRIIALIANNSVTNQNHMDTFNDIPEEWHLNEPIDGPF